MMTVYDCSVTCLQLSGYMTNQCGIAFIKTIENVNFFSKNEDDGYVLRIAGECSYQITFKNSVLLSQNKDMLVTWPRGKMMTVVMINCIVSRDTGSSKATFIDSTPAYYGKEHLTILPHYTTQLCPGPSLA